MRAAQRHRTFPTAAPPTFCDLFVSRETSSWHELPVSRETPRLRFPPYFPRRVSRETRHNRKTVDEHSEAVNKSCGCAGLAAVPSSYHTTHYSIQLHPHPRVARRSLQLTSLHSGLRRCAELNYRIEGSGRAQALRFCGTGRLAPYR